VENTKRAIVTALSGDATLTRLLGGPNVYFHRPPLKDAFQRTGSGTISVGAGSAAVVGVGTTFLSDFSIGDPITANGETHVITAVTSDMAMITDAWTADAASVAYTIDQVRLSYFLVTAVEAVDVPFTDETYQIDLWSKSGDRNDRVAGRVRELLHKQPLTVPYGRIAGNFVSGPGIELFEDDTRVHHKVLQLRVLSYPA